MRGVETMNDKELVKYIVAFTYGDGCLVKHGNECRFEATCIEKNLDYIMWRKSILENLNPVTIYKLEDKRPNRQILIKTNTRTHPEYTKVWSRLYQNGRKSLDPHYLKLLDWETLAILYMDDGCLQNVKQQYKEKEYSNKYPNIATMSFSYAENLLLKQTIKENLNIEFNVKKVSGIQKNGSLNYMLFLGSSSRESFYKNISKYILPSFRYKLDNSYDMLPYWDEDIVRTVE